MTDKTIDKKSGIRAAIFSSTRFKKQTMDILGQKVEILQPSVGQLTGIQKLDEQKDKNAVVLLMIDYCYVPGTTDKVFTKEDYDGLMGLPSGEWIQEFQKVWMELAGIDVEEAEKNLRKEE